MDPDPGADPVDLLLIGFVDPDPKIVQIRIRIRLLTMNQKFVEFFFKKAQYLKFFNVPLFVNILFFIGHKKSRWDPNPLIY